jgi:S-methylmethionine-dependent homocysteine/selenocysteine methylase
LKQLEDEANSIVIAAHHNYFNRCAARILTFFSYRASRNPPTSRTNKPPLQLRLTT